MTSYPEGRPVIFVLGQAVRGGLTVSFSRKNGRVAGLFVDSPDDRDAIMVYNGKRYAVHLTAGGRSAGLRLYDLLETAAKFIIYDQMPCWQSSGSKRRIFIEHKTNGKQI